jgi:gamma-tubulin complex component 3
MGQGDLMEYLMDLLTDELDKPAKLIYKHSLRAYLDTAIRSSNA